MTTRDPLKFLGSREVVSSDVLIQRLTRAGFAHPRKVLQRKFQGAEIWRSRALVLPTGARLFARRGYYGTAPFLSSIQRIVGKRRPGLGRVIDALDRFRGIDLPTLKKLLAVRLEKSGAGPQWEKELQAIQEVGIGTLEDSGGPDERLVRRRFKETAEGEVLGITLRAEAETRRQLLAVLLRQFRQQNLVTWNTPEPGPPVVFNGQLFDCVAYSKLRPLRRKSGTDWKSGPVLFDVWERCAEVFDVEAFIERLHRCGDHRASKVRPLGVIGARSFSPQALAIGREFGLVMVNFRELIGEAGLGTMMKAQELRLAAEKGANASAVAEQFTASVLRLKDNPMVSSLCGVAFETFAVAVLRASHFEDVRAGLDVRFLKDQRSTTRDVDASGHIEETWRVIECKALGAEKSVDVETIKKFYTETVPAFLAHIGKDKLQTCEAEIWTTGRVSEEALAYLASLKHYRKVKPAIRTPKDIEVPSRLKKLKRLMDVIARL